MNTERGNDEQSAELHHAIAVLWRDRRERPRRSQVRAAGAAGTRAPFPTDGRRDHIEIASLAGFARLA